MLQNRLYFVYIARQINAIRGYLMETEAKGFSNNQLYTSTDFSAFKPSSVHTFQLLGASLISSMFAGLSAYAISPALSNTTCTGGAFIVFFVVGLTETIGGFLYLSINGKKTADQSVHGAVNIENPEQKH